MKVIHLCTTLEGGAGLCAARIINSTKALGIDVKAIVAHGERSEHADVITPEYSWSDNWFKRKCQSLLCRMGYWPSKQRIVDIINNEIEKYPHTGVFTSPVTLYENLTKHPWLKEADIVHLHWVGNFLDYESFFKTVNKPVVWTIHDQNPGLGGFHLTYWKDIAPKDLKKLDDKLMTIKKMAYRQAHDLTLVAISQEMCNYFQNNSILKGIPFVKINNGIEPDKFIVLDKRKCREVLDIHPQSKVFLFCANNIHQDIKGLDKLIIALESMQIPNILLICIGHYKSIPKASFKIRCEGYVGNNRLQSIYYSAADFFVLASSLEAFAQVPLEAMSCGTPVVAFPCGVIPELINDMNGITCKDFTVESLAESIQTAMNRNYDRETIRKDVVERFSYDKIAKQYIDLYKSVLNK